jgi:hypothetical protein
MMSRPAPEGTVEDEAPPAFATKPEDTRKRDAVQELENRLAMLGGGGGMGFEPPSAPPMMMPVAAPAVAAPAAVKGGKNALLVSQVCSWYFCFLCFVGQLT